MEYIEHLSTTRLYPDGHEESGVATVISEHNLSVIINEQTVYRLVCTKNDLRELVVGRLLTDGFIEKADDIERNDFKLCCAFVVTLVLE